MTTTIAAGMLITETAEEGRELAIKLARSSIKATQPDADVRKALRPDYAGSATDLIAVAQVIATEFATVAAANGYWRR
ncbi:hexameric tyrosine-coordinated heme protein [Pseudonocardia sp. GCM10023141]|uniref:hexameric tyrosine-coordinated heme protein n=1 Tax=Pseudonocardia sp. GCM10023141 TaxID=3252653 RepID=UPI00360E4717